MSSLGLVAVAGTSVTLFGVSTTTAGATSPQPTLTVTPSTNLKNGTVVTYKAIKFTPKDLGSIEECNTVASNPGPQPYVIVLGAPVPVGCTPPVIKTVPTSGVLTGTISAVSPQPGPPQQETDSAGNPASTDAPKFPCPPTPLQQSQGITCQIVFGAANLKTGVEESAEVNISFLPSLTPLGFLTSTTSLPSVIEGSAYSTTLTAGGGTKPYKWSLASGSKLPAGLSIKASTGAITGKPTASGTDSFTIQVTDSSKPKAETATMAFSIDVLPTPTLSVATSTKLTPGEKIKVTGTSWPSSTKPLIVTECNNYNVGAKTNPQPTISDGSFTLPVSCSAPATTVKLSKTGAISATFTVKTGVTGPPVSGTDSAGHSAATDAANYPCPPTATEAKSSTGTCSLYVEDAVTATNSVFATSQTLSFLPPVAITTTKLPAATEAQAYSTTLAATGGTTPYKWSLVAPSTLPKGLKLTATTGAIAGTPTVAGTSSVTIKVTDTSKPTAFTNTKTFSLTVNAPS